MTEKPSDPEFGQWQRMGAIIEARMRPLLENLQQTVQAFLARWRRLNEKLGLREEDADYWFKLWLVARLQLGLGAGQLWSMTPGQLLELVERFEEQGHPVSWREPGRTEPAVTLNYNVETSPSVTLLPAYTIRKASAIWGVSERHLRRLIRQAKLEVIGCGHRKKLCTESMLRWFGPPPVRRN